MGNFGSKGGLGRMTATKGEGGGVDHWEDHDTRHDKATREHALYLLLRALYDRMQHGSSPPDPPRPNVPALRQSPRPRRKPRAATP